MLSCFDFIRDTTLAAMLLRLLLAHLSAENNTPQLALSAVRGALEQEGLVQGDESEYGLFVTVVDGETADSEQQQWWCFTKGGEMLMTGVDDTPIADGEQYEITLTIGW